MQVLGNEEVFHDVLAANGDRGAHELNEILGSDATIEAAKGQERLKEDREGHSGRRRGSYQAQQADRVRSEIKRERCP